MTEGIEVIVVDDDPEVCETTSEIIKAFYTWGEVRCFTDVEEATAYCKDHETGLAIFVLDVFLGEKSGFYFLDSIADKFSMAHEDTVVITGNASDEVVDMCLASGINYLLEKPIRPHALQLAVRAIVMKYLNFAKKLLQDPDFADNVTKL